jgi:hypothetical protein
MERGVTGTYQKQTISGEPFSAFVPNPLPPIPPRGMTEEINDLAEQANRAIGRLDGCPFFCRTSPCFSTSISVKKLCYPHKLRDTVFPLRPSIV